MQWLKNDFLGYLDAWEMLLQSNEYQHLEKASKQKMCLSRENLEGFRITGIVLLASIYAFYYDACFL